MSFDIDPIISDWPYRPDEITVRAIEGENGRRKIQLRLDLGIMQMEVDGRPDGRRIHECESWLAYHQKRQREHDAANPDGAPYLLEPEDCAELMREGVQYYHRYISFWHLQYYELCARDTERNLRLFAFVREHARNDQDKLQFDQWRPYVAMMHARAVATPLIELEQWVAAIGVIEAGIRGIERFLDEYGQTEKASQVGELVFLQRWRDEIVAQHGEVATELQRPDTDAAPAADDTIGKLRAQFNEAIREERYEDAAKLRDRLRALNEPPGDDQRTTK